MANSSIIWQRQRQRDKHAHSVRVWVRIYVLLRYRRYRGLFHLFISFHSFICWCCWSLAILSHNFTTTGLWLQSAWTQALRYSTIICVVILYVSFHGLSHCHFTRILSLAMVYNVRTTLFPSFSDILQIITFFWVVRFFSWMPFALNHKLCI